MPALSLAELSDEKMNQVRYFKDPIPVREISLVTNKYFTKNKLAIAFTESIVSSIPKEMSAKNKKKNILDIR
jgi:LysR family hydrogen peroxide-inducible transcriptional activator